MKRFVFVSFAFLAWAFYELSGGADFQPRVATTQPVATPGVASPSVPEKTDPVTAASLVANPAITPVNAALVTQDPAPAPVAALATPPAASAVTTEPDLQTLTDLDQIRTSLSQGLSLFPDADPIAQPLMLASLEQGAAGLVASPPANPEHPAEPLVAAPPPADIREIRATRVNMRDGPGTTYPVITRLTLGQEVEVLGESGTGWLRLRTLPGQTTGWIAASLVSKATR